MGPHIGTGISRATLAAPLGLALVAALLLGPAPSGAAASGAAATTSVAQAARLGAWVPGVGSDPSALPALEGTVGRRIDIASLFYGFGDWFPTGTELSLADGGRRDVLVSWDMGDTRFTDWSEGRHDDYLRTIGRLAAAHPYPVYVRPWPEMNGDWQPYMPTRSGDRPKGGTPGEFRRAWRHVVDTVREAGGTKIRWVFNPYAATYPGTADVPSLWPGRGYVDVLGMDGYNWGGGPQPWQSFEEIFAPMYAVLTGLAPDLPVWICEVGSREPSVDDGAPVLPGRSKGRWIEDAFATTSFPALRAVVWFHERKERDWRLDSSRGALTAFRRAVAGDSGPASPAAHPDDPIPAERAGPAPIGSAPAPPAVLRPRVRARLVAPRRLRIRVSPAQRTPVVLEERVQDSWVKAQRVTTGRSGTAMARLSDPPRRVLLRVPQLGLRQVVRIGVPA
jgi:hypothetical protein